MTTPRQAAIQQGLTRYEPTRPCRRGHLVFRYTSGHCSACLAERDPEMRKAVLARWNASGKARAAKHRWQALDPKRAWSGRAAIAAKGRARDAGVPFDLDRDYVLSILSDVCPVFGTPFVFFGKKLRPESPSLDRLKPELGYVRGNIVVISLKANAIKSNATTAEVARVAEWMQRTIK